MTEGVDWERIRLFHIIAEVKSFTKAADILGVSQSAVSRQVKSLEAEIDAPLFHRHPRGLVLTEQGEILFSAARDIKNRLDETRSRLMETHDKPTGMLRVTSSVGLGSQWVTQRVAEFLKEYPDVNINLNLTNNELDLNMREADVAIRLRQPQQGDLIQRRLFTIHYCVYASVDYISRYREPISIDELNHHNILTFDGEDQPHFLKEVHWLATAGREPRDPRPSRLRVNNMSALRRAAEMGVGIAVLPAYSVEQGSPLVRILRDVETPSLDVYLAYAEEMKSVARLQVFRDFLISKAQRWGD
jgi:DNA-binding transcriptional LysR family regulator